jgi:DNA-binding NarL/FixJ family response regulator
MKKVYLELHTPSLTKIIECVNMLTEKGVSYSLIEGDLGPIEERKNVFAKGTNHTKLLGSKGMRVLKLLSEGYSYQAISDDTGISIDGVRYYIKKIFKALNVNNGRDAIRVYFTEMREMAG